MSTPTVVVTATADIGEGPFWDGEKNVVHWVDISAGAIMTTDVDNGETQTFRHHEMVGASIPRLGGGMVAAAQSGFVGFDSDWTETHTLKVLSAKDRINDATTDPSGRLWAGSMSLDLTPGHGALWRLDENWTAPPPSPASHFQTAWGGAPMGPRCISSTVSKKQCSIFLSAQTPRPFSVSRPSSFHPSVSRGFPMGSRLIPAGTCGWRSLVHHR